MKAKLEIKQTTPQKILTPTSGFLEGYTHSLNPYVGCAFACSYCYVRRSPVGLFRGQEWGTWVDIKQGVQEKLIPEITHLRKKGQPITIFMSSSTDPYQPLEYKQKVTRSVLEAMVEMPPDFLFVQTRSPLVSRDIDLFLKLKDRLRISMTVETDRSDIHTHFTPFAPPIQARLKAIAQLRKHDLPVQVAIAPVLPFSEAFPDTLAQLVERVVIDDFYTGDGSGGRRTEQLHIRKLYEELGLEDWYGQNTHVYAMEKLKRAFKDEQLWISEAGFRPF